MITPEVLREIKREVKNHISIILNCVLGESTTEDQEIDNPVPGAAKIDKRPVVHPYGFCSRAPAGKIGVTGRVGDHPGARMIIGVRDDKRTEKDLNDGEIVLYNEYGQNIFLQENKIKIGDKTADEPVVLGNPLVEMLGLLFDEFVKGQIVTITSPGNPSAPAPAFVALVEQWRQQYLTENATNILSQETFVRRKP